MTEGLSPLADLITTPFIAVFILSLAALTVFHHHKLWIVGLAFPLLSLIFIAGQEQGVGAWLAHFSHHEEYHLLYNLALLLPGFALIAYYFEHSGVDARLSKYITSDAGLLVAVCLLSAFFDNIPLTKFALSLDGFDWGLLAYAVGFGGSATWFGSSAGMVGAIGAGPGLALVLVAVAGATLAALRLAGVPPTALPGVAARRLQAARREWF